jgi:hypothetical protein
VRCVPCAVICAAHPQPNQTEKRSIRSPRQRAFAGSLVADQTGFENIPVRRNLSLLMITEPENSSVGQSHMGSLER